MITEDERTALATKHKNCRECRDIVARLAAAGRKYCPRCEVVLDLDDFDSNGQYLQSTCFRHVTPKERAVPYTPVTTPERRAADTKRCRDQNPEADRSRKRDDYHARREAGMSSFDAAWIRDRASRNERWKAKYHERRADGMTPKQAAYIHN